MARYLTTIAIDESMPFGPPPPALFAAIGELAQQATKEGTLLDTGGLAPTNQCVRVSGKDGKVVVTDGPFAEAKEVVGGYALWELRSQEEAVEKARQFIQLHIDLWPGFEGFSEVRQVFGDDNA